MVTEFMMPQVYRWEERMEIACMTVQGEESEELTVAEFTMPQEERSEEQKG